MTLREYQPLNSKGKKMIGARRGLTLPQYGTALFWMVALLVFYVISRYNYNLFHSLADGASIVIAACAFTIVWNSRRLVDNHFFLFLGIAFLFFAILDLFHLLGNKNMGVLPEYGNLGPAFYIASRYLLAVSFLIAPLFITRKINITAVFVVYSSVTALMLLSVFAWRIFPVCIVDGVGLTPFKVVSDYVICLIMVSAIALLLRKRQSFDARVLWIIAASIILSIATGLTFTLYTDPFGITNAAGHLFQIASFYLIYLAFIDTTLNKPQSILYRKLKQNEEKLALNVAQLDETNAGLRQEIAERRQAEEALRESETKYRNLFENITEEVHFWKLVRDDQGRIVTWKLVDANKPSLATWGRKLDDIRGRTADQIFGPGAAEHDLPVVRKIMEEGIPFKYEDYFPHLDRYFQFTSIPLGEHFITTGIEITNIKKAQNLAEINQKQLELTNKELESFSYSVSHDLRTPLRAIDGYSRMILKERADQFDEETKRKFKVIRDNVKAMGQLIDDLLAFSRLGRQTMTAADIDMESLVRDVWEELRTVDPGRQVTLSIDRLPPSSGDRALIRQVVTNLLSNAIKFTGTRERAIIEAVGQEKEGETLYTIRDNGVGFDMRFCDKLFGVFQRLHSGDEFEGTGVGLAIVQRIIYRHGGRVWADAEVDKGAAFHFTLPVRKTE